ncbi:DUF6303 family protein [Streptomyces sp. BA2]|uniref:DUF6303 family protein n=1 Tax=Streptomyces sp. BA2 TaxID=436595 RepID=UPI0013224906|nr:DUF6303 family protein [Streptomyces sp. BA2]MWA11207.1 hypothetical protein [Streptomyces sp. BA2]
MPREFTALMSMSAGRWRLYVVLLNTTDPWPEHTFGLAPIPTFTDRTQALSGLGFEPVPGGEWSWSEYSETFGDPASPVGLIAEVRVRSRAEVEA